MSRSSVPGRPRRSPSPLAPVSLAELRAMPATVNVATASAALGVGESTIYDAIARGDFAPTVITVGRRYKVLTSSLIALLEPDAPAPAGKGRVA